MTKNKKPIIAVLIVLVVCWYAFIFKNLSFADLQQNLKPYWLFPLYYHQLYEEETSNNNREVLRFAVISDPQYEKDPFQDALEKAKQLGAEFIVITGDIAEGPDTIKSELKQMKRILDRLKLPYFVVPGDHDMPWKPHFRRVFGYTYKKVTFPLTKTYNNEYSLINKNVDLYLINHSQPNLGLGEAQWRWLFKQLLHQPEDQRQLKLVFMHYQISKSDEEGIKFLGFIFCRSQISGLFLGDTHMTQQDYYSCALKHDMPGLFPIIYTGTTSGRTAYENRGFSLVKYFENKRVHVQRVILDKKY